MAGAIPLIPEPTKLEETTMSDNPFAGPNNPDPSLSVSRSLGGLLAKLALAFGVLFLLGLFLLPFTRRGSGIDTARRVNCRNNLKQIALALHHYHDDYGSFPPAYTVDAAGRPLHSWRTLILPFLEERALYASIDLSKPWNHPVNKAALETKVQCYQCQSSDIPDNHTTYQGVLGEHSVFCNDKPRQISEIKDGTSNTLMIVEAPVKSSIPWMQPLDADSQLILSMRDASDHAHPRGFQFALCDGSIRFVSSNIDLNTLKSLITIDGGETLGEF
jgi:hypothetical protein